MVNPIKTYLLVGGPANGQTLSILYGRSILWRDDKTDRRFTYETKRFLYDNVFYDVAVFDASEADILREIKLTPK